jgi:isoleucyl-tRNA synthetase
MGERTQDARGRSYRATLNLPQTPFAMRANLVEREPRFQERWRKLGLYGRIRRGSAGLPRYILHDGPPYANGSIHLGHLLNKVLKDIVVRSRTMLGHDAPFVPGWDCHGLPIEHRVVKELGPEASAMSPAEIRERCRAYAEKYVKLQSEQLQRLGTLGDYDRPYLTMSPGYEAAALEVFAHLVERGLVYRALRPVHWSIENRTALADQELEYEDREDPSIFVLFPIDNPAALPPALGLPRGAVAHLMIWTTTPWTLPANLAVAVHPGADYGLYRFPWAGGQAHAVVAEAVEGQVFGRGALSYDRLGRCSGAALAAASVRYRHPFVDRSGPVVTADYVSLVEGTGLVHTAPGHGAEDFETGRRLGLEIYCPVLADGTFDGTVPSWLRGRSVWEANGLVVERLRESGHLFQDEVVRHSYPHDWRSKTPTIFRATEQWFIGVDHEPYRVRRMALETIGSAVTFIPAWGRSRMDGMLGARPDWCISRQRHWGLPIPAFFGPAPGQVLLTPASIRAVAARVREHGSGHWFAASPAELLRGYDPAQDEAAPDWLRRERVAVARLEKGRDIFDVWFESGSSWYAVVDEGELGFPADLYLEGSDQHRGWFQLSLLTALGVRGVAPFRTVLTHGFIVDKHGRKMSKSLGNVIEAEDLLRECGADVCRWWVSSLSFENDVKVDLELFRIAGEEYRKVRNTIRFLLSNLGDFDPARDRRELTEADARSIDAWAMGELAALIETVREAYRSYRFRQVHDAVFHFCNETLSAVYLSAVKDRLYCDRADSDRRRRTQTVMYDIADALIRLVAPVLVHTADEAYLALVGRDPGDPRADACVHLRRLPEPIGFRADSGWPAVIELRGRVLKALEQARARIPNPLDAGVRVSAPHTIRPFEPELADLCGVSRFEVQPGPDAAVHVDDLTGEPRCERSWKRDGTVRPRSDGGYLTDRDAQALGVE